jgi:hypothetical protein
MAALALIASMLGSLSGWLYTVRKLNEQVAYRPVAAELPRADPAVAAKALRLAKPLSAKLAAR